MNAKHVIAAIGNLTPEDAEKLKQWGKQASTGDLNTPCPKCGTDQKSYLVTFCPPCAEQEIQRLKLDVIICESTIAEMNRLQTGILKAHPDAVTTLKELRR